MGDSYDHALSAGGREGADSSDRHRQCVHVDVDETQCVDVDQTQCVDVDQTQCVDLDQKHCVDLPVDQTPSQIMIQRNRESLEKKLLSRRPMSTLVEQGIMPEYKTSPSLHMQKTKLERAKMGDMLRSRISHRPGRAELVHRHILEDVRPGVDPSLCDRQRQLKRAKLADSLASQLSLRPGPLELIQKNILHTDDPIEQAVKEGAIEFRPTVDGAPSRPGSLTFDEDSSDMALSPQVNNSMPPSPCEPLPSSVAALLAQFSEQAPPVRSARSESLGDINANQYLANLSQLSLEQRARSGSFGGSDDIKSLVLSTESYTRLSNLQIGPDGKERKKLKARSSSKPKMGPKPQTIKFHEYKGPPASLKRKKANTKTAEQSAYELLLEQQQLFLQWQLENRSKFSQILLPAPSKGDVSRKASLMSSSTSGYMSGASSSQASSIVTSPANSIPGTPRSATPRASTPTRSMILTPQDVNNATSLLNKMEGMKVNDLKLELKKRNLPVSGSKPALVQRLKPALVSVISAGRKQFQQPYKQIAIPHGGLIILKPSPNSQLVSEIDSNSEMFPGAQFSQKKHEQTPEIGDKSEEEERHLESKSEFERNLNTMEIDQSSCMLPHVPPPPPLPPTQHKTFTTNLYPKPLPPPPVQQIVHHSPHQFLPPQQTSQQILLAKSQLEAQLSSTQSNSQIVQSNTTRAGPKGQFIWPPVNVESPQGPVVTIRATANSLDPGITATKSVQNRTNSADKPVVQLAAVSSKPSLLMVQLPLEPVPASELGMMMPPDFNFHRSDRKHLYRGHELTNLQSILNNNLQKVATDPLCEPEYQLLPATLPPPEQSIRLARIKEEQDSSDNTNKLIEDDNSRREDIIKEQQEKILELQNALALSNEQLHARNNVPKPTGPSQSSNGNSSNTKLLLAKQIQSKQLAAQMNHWAMQDDLHQNTTHQRQNGEHFSMNDVAETILQNKEVPESIENYIDKSSQNSAIDQAHSDSIQFPQLDFNFDLLPDFSNMLQDKDIKVNIGNLVKNQSSNVDQMEVDMDMDVQDWLDSLVLPLNTKTNHGQPGQNKEKENQQSTWS